MAPILSHILPSPPATMARKHPIQPVHNLSLVGDSHQQVDPLDHAHVAEELPNSSIKLDARQYKQPTFATHLLDILRSLRVLTWSNPEIRSQDLHISKVSGSLTNAIFFVSCPIQSGTQTVLLRIYGPSSDSLISRPKELYTLHLLSSRYHIGPRVYGTFYNGRIEEYFESTTLTAADIRVPKISCWIAARMAELHSVDISLIEGNTLPSKSSWHISTIKNIETWLPPAERVLALPGVSESQRINLNLDKFRKDWSKYMQWLRNVDDINVGSRRVFAHNDTQYGNLLRLNKPKEGADEHCQIIVVDFEYAGINPASFDIANHFHEWTANYHADNPHLLDFSRYPTQVERFNFYKAYTRQSMVLEQAPLTSSTELSRRAKLLDDQVRYWSPASHAMWAIWGIVQAREDVENVVKEPEFDYLGYSRHRMNAFRRELASLIQE